MASLIDLQPGERVVTILPVRDLEEDSKFVLFATRNGTVKKTALKDFSNVMSRGIIAINIDKDDELIIARITDGEQVIFLATHDGMAIRFNEQDLRPMGRPATGNRGINLRRGDYLIGAAVTPSNEARNRQRLELAARTGLTRHVKSVLEETGQESALAEPGSSIKESSSRTTKDVSSRTSKESSSRPEREARSGETPASASLPGAPSFAALSRRVGSDAPDGQEVLGSDHPEISPEAAAKLARLDEKLGLTPCLILTVSENGFGKRTGVDAYRLQSRGGKGVISMKTSTKIGKVTAINLVDDTTEMMLISQFGKIIRIDTKTVRSAGRSTSGVKLLNLDTDDKVAAAVVIPPEDPKSQPENGTLLQ
jgi:DNA gyrase subunit A